MEALRLAPIQNQMGVEQNINAGLTLVEFSPEIMAQSRNSLINNVIPGWISRLGGADHPIISVFNEKIGPMVGLRINPDGSVDNIP